MSKPFLRTLPLVAAVLVLSACQSTVVERMPEGTVAECPAEWRGAFIALDDNGHRDGDFAMFVADDCTIEPLSSDPKDGPPPELRLHPRFLANGSVVLFADPEVRQLLELREDELRPPESQWPFHWSRDAAVLTLEAPDHRRIATLIVNGGMRGTTHWNSSDEGFNILRGEPAALRDALGNGQLFDDADPIRLEHVGAKRDDAVRAQRKAAKDGKAR